MTTRRAVILSQLLAFAGTLVTPWVHAQTVPPPGVSAARPPTERTLQPVDRSQTRERVRTSRDCRKEVSDIKDEYRIQEKSVNTQYEPRIAQASAEDKKLIVQERDAKVKKLHGEGEAAAKKLGDLCRADNATLLQNTGAPLDRSPTP